MLSIIRWVGQLSASAKNTVNLVRSAVMLLQENYVGLNVTREENMAIRCIAYTVVWSTKSTLLILLIPKQLTMQFISQDVP